MKKSMFFIFFQCFSLILLYSITPVSAAVLGVCGHHELNIVMEQVPASWPEYNKHANHMWLWNQYMDIYRYVPSDGTFGDNGDNEFVGYPSNESLYNQYETNWGPNDVALTFITTSCECCEITEADIAFNPAVDFTMDRTFAEDNPATVYFYDTVLLHEMGHSWGMQIGNEIEDYRYWEPTVMHAANRYSVQDSMQIHVPEAWYIRRLYDAQKSIPDLVNMGVISKYADASHLTWTNSTTDAIVYEAGENITVFNLTIENTGTMDLDNVHLRLYLSIDRTINSSDTLIGDWFWGSFPVESYGIYDFTTTIPSGLANGNYFVGAIVTYDGYTEDGLIWDNSTRLWDTILINSPDLVIENIVTNPTSPFSNKSFDVTITYKNQGPPTVDSFFVDFYRHRTTPPPAGLAGEFSCFVSGYMPTGVSMTCSGRTNFDSAGTYQMWAQIDKTQLVGESNEDNNVFGPLEIVVKKNVDLIIQSLTNLPINPTAGQGITVIATVKNQGADSVGNFYVGIYKNLASQPEQGQGADTSCSIAAGLSPGATATCIRTISYDTAGTYSMYARADNLEYVDEVSEGNNNYGPKTIIVTSPATLTLTPGDGLISFGEQRGVFTPASKTYTVKNIGVGSMNWNASKSQPWVSLSLTGGTLPAGASASVTVSINNNANLLIPGSYSDTISFTNVTNSSGNTIRPVTLNIEKNQTTILPAIFQLLMSD